jgi:hypothetical protein
MGFMFFILLPLPYGTSPEGRLRRITVKGIGPNRDKKSALPEIIVKRKIIIGLYLVNSTFYSH